MKASNPSLPPPKKVPRVTTLWLVWIGYFSVWRCSHSSHSKTNITTRQKTTTTKKKQKSNNNNNNDNKKPHTKDGNASQGNSPILRQSNNTPSQTHTHRHTHRHRHTHTQTHRHTRMAEGPRVGSRERHTPNKMNKKKTSEKNRKRKGESHPAVQRIPNVCALKHKVVGCCWLLFCLQKSAFALLAAGFLLLAAVLCLARTPGIGIWVLVLSVPDSSGKGLKRLINVCAQLCRRFKVLHSPLTNGKHKQREWHVIMHNAQESKSKTKMKFSQHCQSQSTAPSVASIRHSSKRTNKQVRQKAAKAIPIVRAAQLLAWRPVLSLRCRICFQPAQ